MCSIVPGFTPGPRAMRNKTYPLNEILEALTSYNRGNSLEETSRRLSSRHGHSISPGTIVITPDLFGLTLQHSDSKTVRLTTFALQGS